jgi:hypothetical protein
MQYFLALGAWVVIALALSPKIGSFIAEALGADESGRLPRAHGTFRHFRPSRNEITLPAAPSKPDVFGQPHARRSRDAKGHSARV